MRIQLGIAEITDAIENHAQRTLGCLAGIQLFQRTSCGVSWVRIEWFASFLALAIHLIKTRASHVYFTSHFEGLGQMCRQPQWKCADGLEILRHVIAHATIATCCGIFQHSFFIAHGHGDSIHLRLDDAADCFLAEPLLKPREEVPHLAFRVGIVQAHHPHGMSDLGEALQRRATHSLRR